MNGFQLTGQPCARLVSNKKCNRKSDCAFIHDDNYVYSIQRCSVLLTLSTKYNKFCKCITDCKTIDDIKANGDIDMHLPCPDAYVSRNCNEHNCVGMHDTEFIEELRTDAQRAFKQHKGAQEERKSKLDRAHAEKKAALQRQFRKSLPAQPQQAVEPAPQSKPWKNAAEKNEPGAEGVDVEQLMNDLNLNLEKLIPQIIHKVDNGCSDKCDKYMQFFNQLCKSVIDASSMVNQMIIDMQRREIKRYQQLAYNQNITIMAFTEAKGN